MSLFVAVALLSADPVVAPWDTDARLKIVEARQKTHDRMFDEVQTRLLTTEARMTAAEAKVGIQWPAYPTAATACPCGIPGCQCGCATGGACKCIQAKADAPKVNPYLGVWDDAAGKIVHPQAANINGRFVQGGVMYDCSSGQCVPVGGMYGQDATEGGACGPGGCGPQQQQRGNGGGFRPFRFLRWGR